MPLMTIEEAAPAPAQSAGRALFALGFRPFYLLAAAFAAVSVPAWIAAQAGLPLPARIDMAWHMHEMVFGFTVAVLIGFLYTAGYNWTKLWTPRGIHLAALAGLWILGRVAMLAAPRPLAALVDLAFLPAAAWPLYRVLERSGNRRNMFLVGLLGLLTIANGLHHAIALGWLALDPFQPVHAAVMLVVVIESVIGGRVIPMFTSNAVPGSKPVKSPRRDRAAIALTVLAGAAWTIAAPAAIVATLAACAAVAQGGRLAAWQPQRTWRNPLLWVLHLSYAWIPCGFAALALAQYGALSQSAALHLLTVGSLAGLVIGMITRTALGHTGRPLKAGRGETLMYALVQAAVLARLAAGVLPAARMPWLVLATACWSTAFLAYLFVYLPYLTSPRADGREG
jgi:uncharacterized protein involved in response to NO